MIDHSPRVFISYAQESEALYRLLTNQPATPAPALGKMRRLAAVPRQEIANPYPGLATFRPEEHRFFFGREADTTRCTWC